MADPYQTLGIAKGASEKEIKSAYRKLAKELHPDRNKDNPKASERFSDATRAYDLLSDKDKRARFDRGEIDADGNPAMPYGFGQGGGGFSSRPGGAQGGFGNEGIDLGDIFDGLFGGGAGRSSGGGFGGFGARGRPAPPPAKGANVAYRLSVEFTEAARLDKQRITLEDGQVIDLSLPKGVESGTQMKLAGKGRPGPGGAGDAIVTIDIKPHRFFEREGHNVVLELPVTIKEALLGGKVKVPTVDGAVMLTVPAGSDSGKTLRLKGKGFHDKSGARGDQLVRLMIVLPDGDPVLTQFVESWSGGPDPRSALGI
jgi:DnaJ-class molecular chaperone